MRDGRRVSWSSSEDDERTIDVDGRRDEVAVVVFEGNAEVAGSGSWLLCECVVVGDMMIGQKRHTGGQGVAHTRRYTLSRFAGPAIEAGLIQ